MRSGKVDLPVDKYLLVFVCLVRDLTDSKWCGGCSTFDLAVIVEGPDLLWMVEGPGFGLLMVDVAEGLPCLAGLPVIGDAKRSCAWGVLPFVSMKVSASVNVSTWWK